jgi:hypothetical protein
VRVLNVFEVEGYFSLAIEIILLGVKIFAFVNCLTYASEAFPAADKLTKAAWGAILGLGLILQILLVGSSPINLINLAFTIAALVYLADVRPALASLTRR